MLEAIKETTSYIREKAGQLPEIAIILGTGLGELASEIEIRLSMEYSEIPNFPVSTVDGHDGRMIIGKFGNREIIALKGRFHYYEGYTMEEVTFPVRVLRSLGVTHLFISNAAGGLNPAFSVGDVMFINDHINLMPNPLLGKHYPEYGERFPDMSEVYNKKLIREAMGIAGEIDLKAHTGCYIGVTGPTLETPKEYEYFRIIGGDAVGMSTVPEAIVAHQMHLRIFALSVITDLGVPGKIEKISHELVLEAATRVTPKLTTLVRQLIRHID